MSGGSSRRYPPELRERRSRSSGGYLLDEPPDMTPSFPRTGVSGHAGAVHRHRRDRRRVSVLSRGFGSDDVIFSPGEVKEIDVEFPSPLGVLGLTTTRISAKPVSAIQFPSPLGVLGLTTSRTICSSPGSMRFPSPLGVLGLTTGVIRAGRRDCCRVSVPSRGFGSDDWRFTTLTGTRANVSVPSRGFGSDPRNSLRVIQGFRPLSGFWV